MPFRRWQRTSTGFKSSSNPSRKIKLLETCFILALQLSTTHSRSTCTLFTGTNTRREMKAAQKERKIERVRTCGEKKKQKKTGVEKFYSTVWTTRFLFCLCSFLNFNSLLKVADTTEAAMQHFWVTTKHWSYWLMILKYPLGYDMHDLCLDFSAYSRGNWQRQIESTNTTCICQYLDGPQIFLMRKHTRASARTHTPIDFNLFLFLFQSET